MKGGIVMSWSQVQEGAPCLSEIREPDRAVIVSHCREWRTGTGSIALASWSTGLTLIRSLILKMFQYLIIFKFMTQFFYSEWKSYLFKMTVAFNSQDISLRKICCLKWRNATTVYILFLCNLLGALYRMAFFFLLGQKNKTS